jgi:hypothetical protein
LQVGLKRICPWKSEGSQTVTFDVSAYTDRQNLLRGNGRHWVIRLGEDMGMGGLTYHFQFDRLGVSGDKHRHPMVNGLISCPIVRENKGEVHWFVPVLNVEIPIRTMLIFHFVFSVKVG